MNRLILIVLCAISITTLGACLASANDEPGPVAAEPVILDRPVDFQQDVLPIFRAKCLACHSTSVQEGSLVLESAESLLEGGDTGPAVVAGKPEESLFLKLASRTEESFMPPLPNDVNAKPLTPHEVGLLTLWIREGARTSASTRSAIEWQSIPARLQPIYSLALSPEETLVAAGRGSRIAVYDVLRQRQAASLIDPTLGDAAHRDFVHSLDFSPDGQWIASGGYRIVKLWKKVSHVEEQRPLEGDVKTLALSPDSRWIATGRSDGSIRLEPQSQPAEARLLEGTAGAVSGLAFTNDSTVLYSVADEHIRRWNVADGALVGELVTPSPVLALLPSPDSAQLVTGHADGAIRIWPSEQIVGTSAEAAIEPAIPQAVLHGHEGPVTSLVWTGDKSPRLVSGSEDATLRHWDTAAGTETLKVEQGEAVVRVVRSPDGSKLAALGGDGVVRVWDTSGKMLADLKGDPRQNLQIARLKEQLSIAQSRKSVAAAAATETEKDITSREASLKRAKEQLVAAEKTVAEAASKATQADKKHQTATDAATARPDDSNLKQARADAEQAAESSRKVVRMAEDAVVSARRGVELAETGIASAKAELDARRKRSEAESTGEQHAGEAFAAAEAQAQKSSPALRDVTFTTDGSALATVDANGLVCLWHLETQRPLVTIPTDFKVVALSAATDGRLLAATRDGHLLVIRTEPQWELAGRLGPPDESGNDVAASALRGRVLAMDFSPDGTRLATGSGVPSQSGQLAIWNVATRTLEREIAEAHSDTVFSIAYSRNGTRLASGAADKFARVFDAGTGELVKTLEGHTGHVLGVSWIADGSRLATAGADNVIKVWDMATGEQTRTINSHQKPVTGLSFIGITENIASAGGDKAVLLHAASKGKYYRRLVGATDFLHAVAATRDGSLVIAGGEAGVLRLWNGADGKPITSFDPPAVPASASEQVAR